jgi:hypothetical protein
VAVGTKGWLGHPLGTLGVADGEDKDNDKVSSKEMHSSFSREGFASLGSLEDSSHQVIIISSCDFIVLIFGINYGFSEMGFVNWYAGLDYQAILVGNQSRLRIYQTLAQ